MVREHVGEETDAERDRPEEVAEHVDHQHEGCEERNRAEEVLQVLHAVLARSVDVVGQKRHGAQTEGDVEVRRGCCEAGDETDQIRQQDEDEEAPQERNVALCVLSDHALDEPGHYLDEGLGDAPGSEPRLWRGRRLCASQPGTHVGGEGEDHPDDERRCGDVLGASKTAEPGKGFVAHQPCRALTASQTAATGKHVRPTANPIGSG